MAKPSVEAIVKQGRILRVDAPFDEALTTLREAGCRYPISVEVLAYARMEKDKRRSLNQNGSYTKEGVIYFRDAKPILALNSPLLDLRLARQAVQANRDGKYFSTPDGKMYEKFAKLAEEGKSQEPEKRKAVYLPNTNCTLTTSDADFNNVLRALFKEAKDDYLTFNGQDIPLYLVDKNTVNALPGTVLTQMWFRGLDYRSELGGDRNLDCGDWVRGVSKSERASASEGKTQPTQVSLYTKSQLNQAVRLVKGVRTGNIPASRLEEVTQFLGRLK